MAISPQRLTIYLYSAHREVIFAISQLSCSIIDVLAIDFGVVVFNNRAVYNTTDSVECYIYRLSTLDTMQKIGVCEWVVIKKYLTDRKELY